MTHDTRAGTPVKARPGIQSSSPLRTARCPAHARHRALAAQPPRREPHRRRRARASLPDLQDRDRRERRHALAAVLLAALQAGRSRRVAERVVSDPRRGAGRCRRPAARRGTGRDLSDGPRVARRPRVNPGRRASSRSRAPRLERDREIVLCEPAERAGRYAPPRDRALEAVPAQQRRVGMRARLGHRSRHRAVDADAQVIARMRVLAGKSGRHGGPSRHDGTGDPLYLQRPAQVSAGNDADRWASMTLSSSVHDRRRARMRPRASLDRRPCAATLARAHAGCQGRWPRRTGGVPRGQSFPSSATRRAARRGTVDRPQPVRSISAS